MKYSHGPLRHSTAGGLPTTTTRNLTDADKGVESARHSSTEVGILAYATPAAITQSRTPTRPLNDTLTESTEARDLERYRLLGVLLITVLYVVMLSMMVYLS